MAVSSGTRNSATFTVTTPSDREIRLTRLFDAPRHLVFEALTKPEHIRRWWGVLEEGYSVPVCEVDLRPGGRWRFVSRMPDGEFAFRGVFREVAPPERLVYTEIFEPVPDPNSEVPPGGESVVTAVLADEGGKTRLTVTSLFGSREVRDFVISTGMEKGAAISYDRLEDVVVGLQGK